MKNIVSILIMFVVMTTFAQKIIYKKASDTVSIREIVIPDEVYNENYSLYENGQAYENGSYELSTGEGLEYSGFYVQRNLVNKMLIYFPGEKISPKKSVEILKPASFAWLTILITFFYYFVFLYSFIKNKEVIGAAILAVAAASAAAAVVGLTAVAEVAVASAALLVTAAIVAMVSVLAGGFKYSIRVFILASIIEMVIIWYFLTPLFFVSALAGIICAYILHKITEKKPEQVAEAT